MQQRTPLYGNGHRVSQLVNLPQHCRFKTKLIRFALCTGGFYWIDLADETGGVVVNASSYRFGAAVLGGSETGVWSPNAYPVDLGSDYEALFVYHDEKVSLDSVYVKFQDGRKG